MSVGTEDQPYAPPASGGLSPGGPASLPRTSVLLMVLLTLVTLGLYIPYWFWSRRHAFDRIAPQSDHVLGWTYVLVGSYAGAFLLGFGLAFAGPSTGLGGNADLAIRLVDLFSRILTLVMSFRVKSILEGNYPETLSALGTFFLSIYYLQYKINRIGDTDPLAQQFTLR